MAQFVSGFDGEPRSAELEEFGEGDPLTLEDDPFAEVADLRPIFTVHVIPQKRNFLAQQPSKWQIPLRLSRQVLSEQKGVRSIDLVMA